MISGGQYVSRLAKHFRLLTKERLLGLTVIVQDLHVIDMAELPDAATSASEVIEDAPIAGEGALSVPTPTQAPQLPPPAMMSQARVRYTSYADFQISYERRTRCKTGGASTSTAQQDEQQPDP
nr:hypothetical protein [Tanacetum cinerariifolium]